MSIQVIGDHRPAGGDRGTYPGHSGRRIPEGDLIRSHSRQDAFAEGPAPRAPAQQSAALVRRPRKSPNYGSLPGPNASFTARFPKCRRASQARLKRPAPIEVPERRAEGYVSHGLPVERQESRLVACRLRRVVGELQEAHAAGDDLCHAALLKLGGSGDIGGINHGPSASLKEQALDSVKRRASPG